MKTAVSVPEPLFRRAEALARRLGKTRSALYSDALAEYVARREPHAVTSALNDAIEVAADEPDPWLDGAARLALEQTEW